jgi:hemolysin activation/secretion protein
MIKSVLIGVVSFLCVSAAVAAHGQTAKPPGTPRPGQIEKQFERPPEPSAKPGPINIPESRLTPPPNAGDVKVVLHQVTVDGVTAYRPEALRASYASLLEKEVTLAEIYRVVEGLTAKYRNDGYVLSQVFVPAQTVEGGSIRLQALEGYIANVRVEGGTDEMRRRVKKYGEKIRASRPLRMAALERYVLLVNDLPGFAAQAVLAPSTVPGASDLVLQLARHREQSDLSSDNRGSEAQGPARLSGNLILQSLVGAASRTELRSVTTFTNELFYAAVAHDQFIGAHGGKVGIAASYVYSKPQELSIVPLRLNEQSDSLHVSYSHPIIRRRSRNLFVRGMLTAFDSTSRVFNVTDTVDHVRSVTVGATYDGADRLGGVNLFDVAFSQGLQELGASREGDQILSRSTGRVDFRKSTIYAQRVQSLPAGWSLLFGASGQYAFTDLLASEMFSVGGEWFGRGYDPSTLLNDHGAALKLDLRYSLRLGAKPITLMPFAFGDAGRVWQRTPFRGIEPSQSIASAGGGAWLNVGRQFAGFIEIAKPFEPIVGQSATRGVRVYAGVSVR